MEIVRLLGGRGGGEGHDQLILMTVKPRTKLGEP